MNHIEQIRHYLRQEDIASKAGQTSWANLAEGLAHDHAKRLCQESTARYVTSESDSDTITLLDLWRANDGNSSGTALGADFYADLAGLVVNQWMAFDLGAGGVLTFTRLPDAPSDQERRESIAGKWGPGGEKSADGGPL